MPASCVQPKRSPLGRSRSISAVTGSAPGGPGAEVRMSYTDASVASKNGPLMEKRAS